MGDPHEYLSFRLSEDFVGQYADRKVRWGFTDVAGTSLGETTFLAKYSRSKPCVEHNTLDDDCLKPKETWPEVVRRCIEGMYSIQKDYCKTNRLPWNDRKAQASAQEAFERMFEFKWTPPGRGLWAMGTALVNRDKNSAPLQNCGFSSTQDMLKTDPAYPFTFLMEASMLGIGIGFDDKGADKDFTVYEPQAEADVYVIPDSREGWVISTGKLINSYLKPNKPTQEFDYSLIRPAGSPIKTFGGTAAGPEPLMILHERLRKIFDSRVGNLLSRVDIADIGNLIGVCVVAGNVRRSAELLIGRVDDKDFLNLKNPEIFPDRMRDDPTGENSGWGWMSNNSVDATVGTDYSGLVEHIARNGEPGVVWMDVTRKYGRLIDQPDYRDARAAGYNPCAEQPLESQEMCTLVETYLNRAESLEDYKRTLKFAYLYAKTVTLLPTHWAQTNAIMQRNRRIGTSASGMANFADNNGIQTLTVWLDEGYQVIRDYDRTYSEWLCVRESIRVTTVKPSGTVSLLAGESPGVHWAPGGNHYYRLQRFAKDHPIAIEAARAGYRVERDVKDPKNTVVVYFPIVWNAQRSERDVTIFEKAHLAAVAQKYWSDNSVSVTISFKPEEAQYIGTILHMYEGQLKTASFLPMEDDARVASYEQLPYTAASLEEIEATAMTHFPIDLSSIYEASEFDAEGEAYCSTDSCEVPPRVRDAN